MSGAERVLAAARAELGTKEYPPGSNRVKYNKAYYGRDVSGESYPWCCVFLWWCFQRADLAALFYGGGKTASCGALAENARKNGRFVSGGYRTGDLVFLRFSGRAIQHVGLVERVLADGSLVTIEGNTGEKSEANGGEVQRRWRAARSAAGAYRPAYEEAEMEFGAEMNAWLQVQAAREPGDFSKEARAWAEERGIVRGNAEGALQYKSYCTREQMAVMLYRFWKALEKA